MTPDQRIWAAARAIGRAYCDGDEEFERYWADEEVIRHNWLVDARAALTAACPGLLEGTHEVLPLKSIDQRIEIAMKAYESTGVTADYEGLVAAFKAACPGLLEGTHDLGEIDPAYLANKDTGPQANEEHHGNSPDDRTM